MSIESEVQLLLKHYPKKDIATALVRSRQKMKRDRRAVVDLETQLHEMIDAIGLLRENSTHQDVMNRIYRITGVLSESTDEVESVVEHMDM